MTITSAEYAAHLAQRAVRSCPSSRGAGADTNGSRERGTAMERSNGLPSVRSASLPAGTSRSVTARPSQFSVEGSYARGYKKGGWGDQGGLNPRLWSTGPGCYRLHHGHHHCAARCSCPPRSGSASHPLPPLRLHIRRLLQSLRQEFSYQRSDGAVVLLRHLAQTNSQSNGQSKSEHFRCCGFLHVVSAPVALAPLGFKSPRRCYTLVSSTTSDTTGSGMLSTVSTIVHRDKALGRSR